MRDHGLMALDTIMVELQRCVKNSMAAKIGGRNGGKLEGTGKQWKVREESHWMEWALILALRSSLEKEARSRPLDLGSKNKKDP
ncbi:hypothetical protein DEO72_LG1g2335 [Vigna unguiculata]|uniref:Uncharacterized protein n=1 Tax=Vigna unguiculata TaxID=3917 RepID=A0A4D6KU09_VIGUN|nr:hypothetical protein DEO72_LG1g2335 [Vigna unguiculata]